MKLKQIAEDLILNLNDLDIECYIYYESRLKNSYYIRFEDARIGSIRISDHNGRDKYRYKYNIRADLNTTGQWQKIDGKWSFFISTKNWTKMVDIILERTDYLKQWNSKTTYNQFKNKKK